MKTLLSIIGFIGFILILNEQPSGEIQNWWVNGVGMVMLGGAWSAYLFGSK